MLTPKKKFTKKELKHDPLLDGLEKGKEFYEENSKQIFTALGVLLVIVILGWSWMNSSEAAKNQAMIDNTKATLAAAMGMNENVTAELERVVQEYGKNEIIAQSTLQLGLARMDAGDNDGARQLFSQLANSSDKPLKAAGKLKLAYLNEKESNFADAALLYQEVGTMGLNMVSEYANLQAGYAFVAAGNTQEAKNIVDALLAGNPSGKFNEYVKYLEGKVTEK